jgi:hypothetical protein
MSLVVDLRTEVVHRYIFELRYDFGYVYWDRAGRIAREIANIEGWTFDAIDTNACRLAMRDSDVAFKFWPRQVRPFSDTNQGHA